MLLPPVLWFGRDLITQRMNRFIGSQSRLLLVAAILAAAILFSILGTVHWAASLTTAASWCLLALAAVLAAELVREDPGASRFLLGAMVLSVGLATVIHWLRWKTGESSHYAFYGHPRLMGLHTLSGAFASLALLLQATRRGERIAWLVLGILAWGALFWSGSRSPLVGVAGGLAVWLLRTGGRDRLRLVLATAVLVAGGLLLSLAFWTDEMGLGWWHVAQRTAVTQSVVQITSNRSSFWIDAAHHAAASPWIGYGPDGYSFLVPKLEGAQPHNLFLQLTLDLGAPGAIAALILIACCLWRGWREPSQTTLTAAWLALAAGNVIAAQVDGYFYYPIASIPAWLALGACVTSAPSSPRPGGKPALVAPAWGGLATAAVAILGLNCWLFQVAYNELPPARPDALVARVWRIFPSVTYNIDNWVDAWTRDFPDDALATSLFARPRSQSPEIFRVKTAQLLTRRRAFPEAIAELERALAEVAPEYRATIEHFLKETQAASQRASQANDTAR